jgi:hypothetical protein
MNSPTVLLCALTIATLGCDGLFDPGDDPAIRTDRIEYRLHDTGFGLETEIPFTFRNRAGGPVYVQNCGGNAPPMLQKLEDGRWVKAWAAIVLDCLSSPIVIKGGATYADTLRVFGGHPGNNWYPKFDVPRVPGTYRLLWVGERVSNTFVLAL